MAIITVTCPSGMVGELRGLKGKELRLLSDKTRAVSGQLYDDLLKSCWVNLVDPGIYDFSDAVDWADVLVGDRFYCLIQIRQATYPDEAYAFKVTCRDQDCKKTFEWDVDLDDLNVKDLPDSSKEVLKADGIFTCEMRGCVLTYKLPTGRDESVVRKRLNKKAKKHKLTEDNEEDAIVSLSNRVLTITTASGEAIKDKVAWLEDLDFSEIRDLLEAFDSSDCGVETTFDVECTACGLEQEVRLPFERAFFMPSKKVLKQKEEGIPAEL